VSNEETNQRENKSNDISKWRPTNGQQKNNANDW